MIHHELIPNVVPEDVFFIHGNLASRRWWYPSQREWEKHAVGRNYSGALIYGEFRGCGKSGAPKSRAEVDMHLFAEDFIGLIKNLGRGPCHVVGHSTGGLIAALMLAKEPSLFRKAVLLNPVGAQGVRFDSSMIRAFEQMKSDRNLTAQVIGSTIHNNNPQDAFFGEVIVPDAFQAVNSVGHWVLESLDGLDVRAELSSVSHEVLVLHGEHDRLLPEVDSQTLATLIKRGRFMQMKDVGHCPNIESPEKFVNIARTYLFG